MSPGKLGAQNLSKHDLKQFESLEFSYKLKNERVAIFVKQLKNY